MGKRGKRKMRNEEKECTHTDRKGEPTEKNIIFKRTTFPFGRKSKPIKHRNKKVITICTQCKVELRRITGIKAEGVI